MIRQGNTKAIGILVTRHRAYIANIAGRFLLADEDVCEVVQDTFIRVWKHIDEFDDRNRFTTWLYTIAFNLCLDKMKAIRKKRKIFERIGDTTPAGLAENQPDPSGKLDDKLIAKAVRRFADELGDMQRAVFVLRDLQDLPVEEVCRITGFDAVKVKTNLYYARKYMREKLLKGGYL